MTVVLPPHLNTVRTLPYENTEVVVWPFTATNSYWVLWVAHAWAHKIIVRQQNHCKSVTYYNINLSYQDLGRRRTETTHHQRVGRSESHGH